MVKSIQIYCTQFGPTPKTVSIVDGVTTLQELKSLAGISGNNWTAMGRPSKTPYVFAKDGTSSQIINSSDITISFYPVEMKAGLSLYEVTALTRELQDMELIIDRLLAKITGTAEVIADTIETVTDSTPSIEMDDYTKKMLGN